MIACRFRQGFLRVFHFFCPCAKTGFFTSWWWCGGSDNDNSDLGDNPVTTVGLPLREMGQGNNHNGYTQNHHRQHLKSIDGTNVKPEEKQIGPTVVTPNNGITYATSKSTSPQTTLTLGTTTTLESNGTINKDAINIQASKTSSTLAKSPATDCTTPYQENGRDMLGNNAVGKSDDNVMAASQLSEADGSEADQQTFL